MILSKLLFIYLIFIKNIKNIKTVQTSIYEKTTILQYNFIEIGI